MSEESGYAKELREHAANGTVPTTTAIPKDIQLKAGQWQPIETAPKDGTPIIVLGVIFFNYREDGSKHWSERDYSCVTNYNKDRQHLQQDEWCFVAPGIQTMMRARLWTPYPSAQDTASASALARDVPDESSLQHDPEMLRMLALRKELDPDAPDAIVLPAGSVSKSSETVDVVREFKDYTFEYCGHDGRDRNYDFCSGCAAYFMRSLRTQVSRLEQEREGIRAALLLRVRERAAEIEAAYDARDGIDTIPVGAAAQLKRLAAELEAIDPSTTLPDVREHDDEDQKSDKG